MDHFFEIIVNSSSFYLLCGLLGASLLFVIIGIKNLRKHGFEGFLYIIIALFFLTTHIFYLYNLPIDSSISFVFTPVNLWNWALLIFAPTLILLFLLFGLLNIIIARVRIGLIKIFFGLSLLYYLFVLGSSLPASFNGIITIVWSFIWFNVELSNAR